MPEQPTGQELYSGSDLEAAYAKSAARLAGEGRAAATPPVWAAGAWAARAAVRHASQKLSSLTTSTYQEVRGLGYARRPEDGVRVRYVGDMYNFKFLIDSCFDTFEVNREKTLGLLEAASAVRRTDEDLLLVDAESPLMSPRVPALQLPPWLKQRIPLPTDWADFIAGLPRGTRREVARFLRKYGYQARLSDSDPAFERFHRDLYRPHVSRRFGEQAFVVDEAAFRRDRAGARLVELLHDGEVVAANVVRTAGDTMWILWCGFSEAVDSRDLKGVTDVLDYFSLLYASCRGIRQVDLGRSRPRLNDGPLLYKAKWNPRVQLGALKKPPMLIIPRNLGAPVAAALARSQWITRRGARLTAVMLFDEGIVSEEDIGSAHARYRQPGIDSIRLCSVNGFHHNVDQGTWLQHGVKLVDLADPGDPVKHYLDE